MKMSKKLLFAAAAAVCAVSFGAEPLKLPFNIDPQIPRKIEIGKTPVLTLTPGNFEVVQCSWYPTSELAAKEIADALSEVFESKITPVKKASGNKIEIRVGDRELAKNLGIDIAKFDRDGFVIKTDGKKILIIGRDRPDSKPLRNARGFGDKGEWATLFGAYDFLERFAGVRYYYPGKLGTCVPKAKQLAIPAINIYDRPDFLQRRFTDYNHGGRPCRRYKGWDGTLNTLRNRMETIYIPNCHGLDYLGYYYRFKDSHPEYFALNVNGKRMFQLRDKRDDSQLCFSSGIKQEIIKDAVSFLKKEPASVRGVKNRLGQVGWNIVQHPSLPCFNIMPNDSAYLCRCPQCWKHFSKGPQATTDYFWQFFIDICGEVRKSGIPGYLTTMAYADYRRIPTQAIPENLLVMLAIRGPWNEYLPANRDSDVELLKAWTKKLGQKTWLWTYPGKYGGTMPGIPHSTPRSLASFIKRVRPYIFGIFIETDTDSVFFNYLTYHVFGKLVWDPSTDVEKLLDEHVKNLYGPAAKPMKELFDSLERNWSEIAANVVETSEGPKTIFPSELVLWSKIYSPEELKRLNGLLDQSEKLAAGDKLVLARLKLLREELLGPLMAEAAKFRKANDATSSWQFPMGEFKGQGAPADGDWAKVKGFHLAGLQGSPSEVSTVVKAMYDAKNFYFRFDCSEPETEKIKAFKRPYDEKEIWQDNDVELFVSPDGDRQHYYQLLINHLGSWTDLRGIQGAEDHKWNSNAKVSAEVFPGKGWRAEVILPRSSMRKATPEGILVNFTRQRVLKGTRVVTPYYCWSPFARKFGDVSRFGKLLFKAQPEKNLILNPDFLPSQMRHWGLNRPCALDKSRFMTEGSSVKLECGEKVSTSFYQYLKGLKPETEYEFSFFARLDNVKKLGSDTSGFYMKLDMGNGKVVFFPPYPIQMDGTCPWTGFSLRVRTPKNYNANGKAYITFILRKASGTAWVDHVSCVEVPGKK